MTNLSSDRETAAAFALSWNSLPPGSIYTKEQFEDWLAPLKKKDIIGRTVLELGCGNGSLMLHLLDWNPKSLHGVDLGDSVRSAKENILLKEYSNCSVEKADLTEYRSKGYDLVYSIGVLHHLNDQQIKSFYKTIKTYMNEDSFLLSVDPCFVKNF